MYQQNDSTKLSTESPSVLIMRDPHYGRMCFKQAWGQCTRYFGTLVLEYQFCSTRRYSVLVLLKSTCTRTCTQVLLKMKVLLTSTYEYFTSTIVILNLFKIAHIQIINQYSGIWNIQLMIRLPSV